MTTKEKKKYIKILKENLKGMREFGNEHWEYAATIIALVQLEGLECEDGPVLVAATSGVKKRDLK